MNILPANKFTPKGKFRKTQSTLLTPENSGLRFVLNPVDIKAKFETQTNKLLNTKWSKPRTEFRSWFANRTGFKIGEIQQVAVQSDVWIINTLLFDENNSVPKEAYVDGGKGKEPPIEKAMKKIAELAKYERATIHVSSEIFDIPNFEALATKHFLDQGLSVYVYQAPVQAE
jgi:hypothetical protein